MTVGRSPIHTEDVRSSAAPPTVKDRISKFTPKTFVPAMLHQLSRTDLQCTPKTFVPALLHQWSKTGSPIHTEDFRSSAAPPTVKDRFSNSHRRLSFQRCSTNCQGQVFQFTLKTVAPALPHQLSRTRISNSHRRHSLQRCSTNCQGRDLQFTSKTFVPRFSTNCQGRDLQFTPKTFVPALVHQLSRTGPALDRKSSV